MQGVEWLIEAFDCDPARLAELAKLEALFDRLIRDLSLHPVRPATWHQFGEGGGITGMCVLAESHLACHTFPEHRSLTLNLFCCKPRPDCDFESYLVEAVGARHVCVRKLTRTYGQVQ